MQIGVSLPSRRALALPAELQWRLALAALVAGSAAVRTWAAWLRAAPAYFPDEGIYAALSRSLAAGHLPQVRGHVAHFPALLQPLVTAPAWWFGSLETGYRLTQAIDAVALSTVALAVWWTARRLGIARGTALAAAALALAVPDAGYSAWVLAEPFAYPLFVAAVGAGAVALARPTRRGQALFLGLALLAAFARLQLAVLPLAYLAAALLLRRGREQRLVVAGLALAVLAALGAGLGYYEHAPTAFHLVSPVALGRNAFVLALAAGWVVVPAGVLGLGGALARPRTPEEGAFGALALVAGLAVLGEATLYGDAAVAHERYGCYLLPLLALGLALHADRGWPWRRAHALLAAVLFLVVTTVPLSGWAAAGGNAHSLVLTALLELERLAGSPGAAGLVLAGAGGVLMLAAMVIRFRAVVVLGIAFCIATSILATSFDVANTRAIRAAFLPAGPEWVRGDATLVLGPLAGRTDTLEQFFWNRGLDRLALLPAAQAPDVFVVSHAQVAGGRVAGVDGRVVLDEDGAALVPVAPLTANGNWLEARTPELAAELDGRYGDGWLAPAGRVRLFRGGSLRLTVTAPVAMKLTLGARTIRLARGVPTRVAIGCDLRYRFSTSGYAGLRPVSARATFPVWARSAAAC